MNFINRISTAKDIPSLVGDLTRDLDQDYEMGLLFISGYDQPHIQNLVTELRAHTRINNLIGCAGYGVIGGVQEIEDQPAAVLMLANMPGVQVRPFYYEPDQSADLDTAEQWYELLDVYPNEKPKFIVLSDAMNTELTHFLEAINTFYANSPVIGALASFENTPEENTLIVNNRLYTQGIIGLCLTGPVHIECLVAQGCRPIGENYIITQAEDNVILEVAGRPFYEVLEEILTEADEHDQELAQDAIFIGIAMNEYKHRMKQGDFMIRMLMGIDEDSGAGVISDQVQIGQTLRIHVRDPIAADQDLKSLLEAQQSELMLNNPRGALVFSCSARGSDLFGTQGHDIRLIHKYLGNIPAAGFFCAGELGPVYGKNFLHGVSSILAIFYAGEE